MLYFVCFVFILDDVNWVILMLFGGLYFGDYINVSYI